MTCFNSGMKFRYLNLFGVTLAEVKEVMESYDNSQIAQKYKGNVLQ